MADPTPAPEPSPPAPTTDPAPSPTPTDPPKTDPAPTPEPPAFTLTKYDFKDVKLPEGVQLDSALIEAVSPVLLGMKVSQEDANKLLEAQVKHIAAVEVQREKDFKAFMAKSITDNQNAIKQAWGASYDANLVTAQRGIARFVSPAMKALLDETGLGSHPEFLKSFLEIGKMVKEDTPPNGGDPPGTRKSTPEVLYGTTQ